MYRSDNIRRTAMTLISRPELWRCESYNRLMFISVLKSKNQSMVKLCIIALTGRRLALMVKHKYDIIIISEIRYHFAITNIIGFNIILNMIAIWWKT